MSEHADDWFESGRLWHFVGATVVTVLTLAMALISGDSSSSAQVVALGIGVLLLGIPHGAVDHVIAGSAVGLRGGRAWLLRFVGAYVLLAAIIAVTWWLLPVLSLIAFLIVSAIHFGVGDADDADPLAIAAHGATPIVVPVVAHPAATADIFAVLTSVDAADVRTVCGGLALPLGVLWTLLATAFVLRSRDIRSAAELAIIAASGVLLSPLISFVVYFCFWHSPRHMLAIAHGWDGRSPKRAVARFAREALPFTVATAVLAGVAIWSFPSTGGWSDATLQVIFIGLAALTVPHMIVTERARRAVARA